MNKDDTLIMLKAKVAEALEKKGSSLLAFEELLEKSADGIFGAIGDGFKGLVGGAADLGSQALKGVGGAVVQNLPEFAVGGALLGGTTLGGLHYAAGKHLDDQDKGLKEKREVVERYKQLTDRIKSDYGL